MTPEQRWRQVRDALEAVIDLDADGRARFMAYLAERDPSLAADVAGYLAAAPSESFLSPVTQVPEFLMAPGTRLGPYELMNLLGCGGMGEVWKAKDTRLGRAVAIKMLPDTFAGDAARMARFDGEARLLASLNHPNIATVYGLEQLGDTQALVLELVEGPTLAERLRQGAVAVDEVLRLVQQIVDALEAAHTKGITHRDIKPANIACTADGRVKVLDFGLAKGATSRPEPTEAVTNAPASGLTEAGGILGTPAYMSPEQVRGEPVDHRADLWALGCVLFELLSGVQAFGAPSVAESFSSILGSDPDWARLPSDTPASLRTLIERCLKKHVDGRPRSVAALRAILADRDRAGRALLMGLPVPRTAMVGRDQERRDIAAHLGQGRIRLLTLTGPGGTGKTRLAVQVARELAGTFVGGVRFVSLAGLRMQEAVAPAIAQAFGLRLSPDQIPDEALVLQLARELDAPTLLVLDNFEHLLTAASLVSAVLDVCPTLAILVTSRIPLRISGEQEFPVPPLALPPAGAQLSLAELRANPAVRLFADRAAAVQPAFALGEETASDVAWICTRLDGLPLAIELAAARVKLFAPAVMRKRLTSRLALLTGGPRDSPDRHQALRKTLDWSHELLDPDEQRLFRRLGVFAGGFTFEAAEAVSNAWRDLDGRILDGIASLTEKSVLLQRQSDDTEGEPRFVMLETIREYALERLESAREARTAHKAHAAYFLLRAEEGRAMRTPGELERWLAMCDVEHDNLRAALDWLITTRSAEWATRMANVLHEFWDAREHFAEGRAYLTPLLDLSARLGRTADRARLMRHIAALGDQRGQTGLGLLSEALSISRELGDQPGEAGTLNDLGVAYRARGRFDEAKPHFEECVRVCRAIGQPVQTAGALSNLAEVLRALGDRDRARWHGEESLHMFRQSGDRSSEGWALNRLADMALANEDRQEAEARYLEALEVFETAADDWGLSRTLTDLGHLALDAGDVPRGARAFARALRLTRALHHQRGTVRVLEAIARLANCSGQHETALTLVAAADSLRERVGMWTPALESRTPPRPAPDALDPARQQDAWQQGRRMSSEAAAQLASRLVASRCTEDPPDAAWTDAPARTPPRRV